MKTLAITGLLSPLGRRMARLASGFGLRVLGIDIKPMTRPFPGVEFIEADIRNPLLPQLFKSEGVDTILHTSFRWRQGRVEEVFDSNVLGTMRLLGAAAMGGVRKVVIPSSTFVYGADESNPAFIDESSEYRGQPFYAYVRDMREVETFVNGFRRQQPEMILTTLRFANILGGGYPSPLSQYLAMPVVPTLLGFDPMFQVVHHDDVLRALGHCLMHDINGVYNIAAPDPMPLAKLIRLADVPHLPILHPLAYGGLNLGRLFSRKADHLAPLPWDFIRYPWVADTTRMREELDFQPSIDATTTVEEFGQALRTLRYDRNTAYRFAQDRIKDAKRTGEWVEETRRRTTAVMGNIRQTKSE